MLKFFIFLISSLVVCFDAQDPDNILLHDKQQGLCSYQYVNCPSNRKEKAGVCCLLSHQPVFFNNFCLACQAGCESFVYKQKDDGRCTYEEL